MSEGNRRYKLLSWVFVGLLVGLCGALGALQYRWIGEASRAEHERLHANLQSSLRRIRDELNAELNSARAAFSVESSSADPAVREAEYASRYLTASSRQKDLIQRMAVVIRDGDALVFRVFDPTSGKFGAADWPAGWSTLRSRLEARAQGDGFGRRGPPGSRGSEQAALLDLPWFDRSEPRRELGWTIVELNLE